MSKPSKRSPERKLQVVLSVLRGEASATEATRRAGVAEQPVHNWKRASFVGGHEILPSGGHVAARWRPTVLPSGGQQNCPR